jgi:tRNA threonylcarbamoyladenosine biosynthesis protein TsaE
MGESRLIKHFESEAELADYAGELSKRLPARADAPLVIGLAGDLGAGKTTFVRAMLRGRGYAGRVPSPTYTLLERYELPGLAIQHLDLYRLSGDAELENLGVRDGLGEGGVWTLVEWPERAPKLAAQCDLVIELEQTGPTARRLVVRAVSKAGNKALADSRQETFNYPR